jgi:hypothetical protein
MWLRSSRTEMTSNVYRVLLHARPASLATCRTTREHAVISVAVSAQDALEAQARAQAMLPVLGWELIGTPAQVSDLTAMLKQPGTDPMDSAYGDYARQWLQIVHDEALDQGSSLHLLSVDYEYLNPPQRLDATGAP